MTKRRKRTPTKPGSRMTLAELRKATAYLDKEFVAELFGTPSAGARKELIRAKRRGRPQVGEGAVRVLTTVERGLLEEADRFRKEKGMTRAEMIGRGLRLVMSRG